MENLKVNLSAPWITFVHEVEALFKYDNDIQIRFDSESNELKLLVASTDKADALTKLLPAEKNFGSVTLKITVIPANTLKQGIGLIEAAFYGNPALSYVFEADTPMGHMEYAVFRKEVVQFFNDQLDDISGNKSTLFQDIAKDILETNGVFFCTDSECNIGKPLGEWP